MDRLGLMVPRLAAMETGADTTAADALTDLRVGLNVLGLQRELWRLPDAARASCRDVFHYIAAHYRDTPQQPASARLCDAMDKSMDLLLMQDQHAYYRALTMLSGIRLALFPNALLPCFTPRAMNLVSA